MASFAKGSRLYQHGDVGRMKVRLGWTIGLWVASVAAAGWAGPAAAQDEGAGAGAFTGGQRIQGTVTAASGDRLTVKTEQGEVYQVVTTTNTRILRDRQPVKVAEITVGSGVGAMGLLDVPTRTVHAMFVAVMTPEQVKEAREGMGKVYILGRVMKIDETTLTILRSDGVTQKIEVDEGTSFKRAVRGARVDASGMGGGIPASSAAAESITLPDMKVGDQVGGRGEVKHGVFVPKELTVLPPGSGRRRRGAEAAGDAGQAPQ